MLRSRNRLPPGARLPALTMALPALAVLALGCSVADGETTAPPCVPHTLNVSAALAGGHITVSPGPGTRDSSPTTQISLLGAPASELSKVTVSGSRTGAHPGRLLVYSQGDGASFVPAKGFAPGELVTVHGVLTAGTQPTPFAWSFTTATPDLVNPAGVSPPTPKPIDFQTFHSLPDLRPPIVTVSATAQTATGDLFLAPYSGIGQYGPMILDEHGGLIWFDPLPAGTRAADFQVQQYEGNPVLTWWQDPLAANGSDATGLVIANSSYQVIAIARAGNGYQADLHEFQITPEGAALITVYDAIDCDLSSVGGPANGAIADTLLQEIDLKTGLVMYEWHSLDHVPLQSSYASAKPTTRSDPYDYFHINSIDPMQDGDLLIDSRNTWAAYDVDSTTGQVRWQLGGHHSSFKLGPGATPAWQHDAREQPGGAITFFDNGAFPQSHPQSRAIELTLDTANMTATLARSYEHRNPLVAGSQGNVQALASGDWMVGWGQAGYLSEVTPSGQILFNAHLPPDWETYRTYVLPWSGQPAEPPAVAAVPSAGAGGAGGGSGGATVYASWNGATGVASWRVLAGASAGSLTPVAAAPRSGFETAIPLPATVTGPYVAAQALDAAGAVIGVSPAVKD
jgi:Arylsulfotransferase (ASST)